MKCANADFAVCLFVSLFVNVFVRPIQCTVNERQWPFLWHSLVNVSNADFERFVLPHYVDLHRSVSDQSGPLSAACRHSIGAALVALRMRHTWAVALFNSWSTLPMSGAVSGTVTDLGDYDQCVSGESGPSGPSGHTGRYCAVHFALPLPRPLPRAHNLHHRTNHLLPNHNQSSTLINQTDFSLTSNSIYRHLEQTSSLLYYTSVRIGVCLPDRCTPLDVRHLLSSNNEKYGLTLEKLNCQVQEKHWNFNQTQIIAIIIFAIISILTLWAAIYQSFLGKKKSNRKLLWFSPVKNIRKLLRTKSSEDDLACIHGLRVLTLLLIIVGHALDWNSLNMFRHSFSIKDRVSQLVLQPLFRGQLTVDTFFYLSGLLTSYITIKYTGGQYSKFSVTKYILLRYLRLTIPLAVFVLWTLLVPKLFNGPVWPDYVAKWDHCYTNWWLNLVYLHNVIDTDKICALHTWYLAADMQLHWMALAPVVVLLRSPPMALRLCVAMVVGSVGWSVVTIYRQHLPPGAIITSKNDFLDEHGMPSEYLRFCYHSLTHAHVFFIGFLFGAYIKHNMDRIRKTRLRPATRLGLWLVALLGYLCSLYSILPWLYGRPYSPLWSAIVFPANLVIWSAVLTLVIWLCLTDHNDGDALKGLLCWRGFVPLSRMTYSVYLTHVWVLVAALGTRRQLIDLQWHSLLLLLLPIVVLSFVVGFVFTILIENPVMNAIDWLRVRWHYCERHNHKTNELHPLPSEFSKIKLQTIEKT